MSVRACCLRIPAATRRHGVPTSFQRSFFSIPGISADTQTLTATRNLPYSREALFGLIADVDSYSAFVPYCSQSRVTRWSNADSNGRRWPTVADLHVGWGGFNEKFTSRLRCIPGNSVEAVSGDSSNSASSVFKTLTTRWSLHSHNDASTRVDLSIRYQFVNPLYAAVSAAVSDQIANMMIEAFEKQAREKLGQHDKLV